MNISLDTKPINTGPATAGVNGNNSTGEFEPNFPDPENPNEIFLDPEKMKQGLHQDQVALEAVNSEEAFKQLEVPGIDNEELKDPHENRSGITKFLINNQKKLNDLAMKICYGGIGVHQLAAASPILKFIPKPISNLFEKGATLYSRVLSGLPAAIFAIEDHKEKNIIPLIGKLSATLSFPLIETVENMPVASSLFCGINTALEAIEEYKGEKVTRKSDGFFHQLEEFAINYSRTWKDSLNKFMNKGGSFMEKFKNLFNVVSLPGYSIAQTLGMLLCRNRMADSESHTFKNKIAVGARTLRAILGIATDFFLLDSKDKSKRTVGATFVASSVLSLIPPWANLLFKGQSQENIDNLINIFGQECKSLDELGNALWAKAKQSSSGAPSLEEEVNESYNDYNQFSFQAMPA
ncbi:MAG: hypothetical protein HRT47_05225 [Candidatus Caenarcaniphilales bacterium]|nr:hypothetical protein [Candidatus Caenarcaniphilales bacterium]